MPASAYACPGCGSSMRIHDDLDIRGGCRFGDVPMDDVEKAYIDIVSVLSTGPRTRVELVKEIHGEWTDVHSAVLERYTKEDRIAPTEEVDPHGEYAPPPGSDSEARDPSNTNDTIWELRPVDEYLESARVPGYPDLQTIYENGPVDGCKDSATMAMISYYEMSGFSWEQTREMVIEWLEDTGGWSRGSWEETSPEALLEKKRHIFEKGYGWKSAAQHASSVISHSNAGSRVEGR